MAEKTTIKTLKDVVIRFSGDSGDGMQLTGTIFSDLSAMYGNSISTLPDFPAEIRAPQGTLSGVSGFQVHIGTSSVYTPGAKADVLVAMNPAALKVNKKNLKPNSIIIIDSDSFGAKDLEKAEFSTDDPLSEIGLTTQQLVAAPISSMVKDNLKEFGLDNKSALRCKNMFALGLICWLFDRPLDHAKDFINRKFGKKPAVRDANNRALYDGFNFGANTHASASIYRVESQKQTPGYYVDINGNKATSLGLVAASERSGLPLFLGSYPITPATDILHELAKLKALGVKTVQAEDEIAGICTAIGASFAGNLAVTTTSGPGLALKSEAIGLAIMAELPLVIVDVQRGGPSTGLPTKTEQTDLMQALYGHNGESPLPIISGITPGQCFDAAYWAAKIAVEFMTPVILLTDSFIANGSTAWRIPTIEDYPSITPNTVKQFDTKPEKWCAYTRNEDTMVRYWAFPGDEGYQHRLGGLEKDYYTGAISTDSANHEKMVAVRQQKVDNVASVIPDVKVQGDVADADLLIVGWGGTYGHLYEAMEELRERGHKVALAHFMFINPLPRNARDVLTRYSKVVVVEQNSGQFAKYLRGMIDGFVPKQYNRVTGQPLDEGELLDALTKIMEE
ncbi:2-oxoacid:acceptor oxidoreductase subunit alpha [Porphyromonas pogonae]|uniref:2-oxoacid:acceptor oxidoreductase subunit alpha n=1 Tax=Porphyromonas pogonae TaxID=867595 RepID=UPI002E76CE47|nr:2-oxoacid:acceptor oxidoreductase subunit alpha [Porphyromonas pogonae]